MDPEKNEEDKLETRRNWPGGWQVHVLLLSGAAILVIWLVMALAAYFADRFVAAGADEPGTNSEPHKH